MGARPEKPELPSPGVDLPPDYVRRLERLVLQMAAKGERREGLGQAHLLGAGEEFIGHRPYRQGEDLRRLDWDLLARSDQAFVRRTRREAAQVWSVVLDTSGSMGIGSPGKLNAGAQLAGALMAVGMRAGVRVQLKSGLGPALSIRRGQSLGTLIQRLKDLRAGGELGASPEAILSGWGPPREVGLVVIIGDLVGLRPKDLEPHRRPGRRMVLLQVLAPEELEPGNQLLGEAVHWFDPEGPDERPGLAPGEAALVYERRLEAWLEGWQRSTRSRGMGWSVGASDVPFEERVALALEGR